MSPDSAPPPEERAAPLPPSELATIPPPPSPGEPLETWEHLKLFRAVRDVLYALPGFFRSDLNISGILATDLFTFNSSLGATIEVQVVEALNDLRTTWDPEQQYNLYRFVRQPQQFPDVILRRAGTAGDILMGIELKGWYVLAKEREPSFRYQVSPAVCAPGDLLVVYPWVLSNVISGSPRLFPPYVIGARYAAEYRNWHWQFKKAGGGDNHLHVATVGRYYPPKTDQILDRPVQDQGGNFGRFARTGLMIGYIQELFREELAGIPLDAWQRFLSAFSTERAGPGASRTVDQIAREYVGRGTPAGTQIAEVRARLQELLQLLGA